MVISTTTTLHNDIVKELQDLIMTLGIDGVNNNVDSDESDSSKETNQAKLELERLVNSTRALIRTNYEIWQQIESSQVCVVGDGDSVVRGGFSGSDKKVITFRRKGYMSIDITMSRSLSSSSSKSPSSKSPSSKSSTSHEETLEESLNRVLQEVHNMPTPTLALSSSLSSTLFNDTAVNDDQSNKHSSSNKSTGPMTTTTVTTQFRYEYKSFPSLFHDIPCLPIVGLIPSNYRGRRNRNRRQQPQPPPQTPEQEEKEQWFDYDSYMDHILLLHPTITKLFLHFFKHHLQTLQVQLGTIHSWLIIEPMYGLQLINEIFQTNLSLNDDDIGYDDNDNDFVVTDDGHFMEDNHHHHNHHDDVDTDVVLRHPTTVNDDNGRLSSSSSSYTVRRNDTKMMTPSSSSAAATIPCAFPLRPIVLHQQTITTTSSSSSCSSSSTLPGLFVPSAQLSLVGSDGSSGGGDDGGGGGGYDAQLHSVKQFLQLIME